MIIFVLTITTANLVLGWFLAEWLEPDLRAAGFLPPLPVIAAATAAAPSATTPAAAAPSTITLPAATSAEPVKSDIDATIASESVAADASAPAASESAEDPPAATEPAANETPDPLAAYREAMEQQQAEADATFRAPVAEQLQPIVPEPAAEAAESDSPSTDSDDQGPVLSEVDTALTPEAAVEVEAAPVSEPSEPVLASE